MLILIAKEGRTVCGPSCPFYSRSGTVKCYGGTKQSPCRMIMMPYFVDCNVFDVNHLRVVNVDDEKAPDVLRKLADQPTAKTRKLYQPNRKLRTLKSDGSNINKH